MGTQRITTSILIELPCLLYSQNLSEEIEQGSHLQGENPRALPGSQSLFQKFRSHSMRNSLERLFCKEFQTDTALSENWTPATTSSVSDPHKCYRWVPCRQTQCNAKAVCGRRARADLAEAKASVKDYADMIFGHVSTGRKSANPLGSQKFETLLTRRLLRSSSFVAGIIGVAVSL